MVEWCEAHDRPYLGLDGDVLRSGMCSDLGFTEQDRHENVRRTSHMAKLAMQSGLAVIVSLITPARPLRDLVASIIPADKLLIAGIDCPLAECQRRDVKGLYARAAAGLVKGMTGVDGTFDPPAADEYRVETAKYSLEECQQQVLSELARRGLLK